jgi:putative CocE/NonD family hydrolase
MTRRLASMLLVVTTFVTAGAVADRAEAQATSSSPAFTYQEVMLPVRDGVHLQTVLLTPTGAHGPLPILFTRTPYGVPDAAPATVPFALKDLAADGYIFVYQNLRGRFKSEGKFELTSQTNLEDSTAVSETTDAYDSVDWLTKHVPGTNGRVGMYGVSYPGLTAALALLKPHPALKAISEQAAPVDWWMNDDMHHFGALRESYAMEYAVLEQADKNKNTNFDFDVYDTYSWYLKAGPLSTINAKYLHGTIPFWNDIIAHPNYDAFWKKEAWISKLHSSTVPNLNVAGFWDQEDPWGPWQIFRHASEHDPDHTSLMVAGPWYHGSWHTLKGDSIGIIPLGGHETAREFRENIEAPFFRYYLHDIGTKPAWRAMMFQTGSNRWRSYAAWPVPEAVASKLYLHADGGLSFEAPSPRVGSRAHREFVSDPASPVPYRQRPISPTYPAGDWNRWEVADQRFVDGRPDVLSYTSAPLDHDLTVTGDVSAHLMASTSGTDADFIVKLIDVYPENAQANAWNAQAGPKAGEYARSLNGYELPIAMEVRRGRYLGSYERPAPLRANSPVAWDIPLRDHDHVFLKGHRLMVQVQSTWFPLIDRNPQRFVPSIYAATASDFVKSTQRVFSSSSLPSYIVLPVVGNTRLPRE